MLASTITHGHLSLDLRSNGDVTITNTVMSQTIFLSATEMRYIIAILQIHGWPMAPTMLTAENNNV